MMITDQILIYSEEQTLKYKYKFTVINRSDRVVNVR